MFDEQIKLIVVVVAVLVLAGLVVAFGRWNHSRLMSCAIAEIEPQDALYLRSEFLDAITAASASQRTIVNMQPFWKGTPYRGYQKYMIIEPLIAEHIVSPPGGNGNERVSWVDKAINFAFCLPMSSLILSDRDWLRMVHDGVSAQNLVIERMRITLKTDSHDHTNIINSGGGNVSAVNQAGRNGRQTMRDVSQQQSAQSLAEFAELANALRLDAVSAPTREAREQLNGLADSVEDEIAAVQPDALRLEGLLSRAARYTQNLGQAMTATRNVLDALGAFGK